MNIPAFNRLLGLSLATFLAIAPSLSAQAQPATPAAETPVAPEPPQVTNAPAPAEEPALRRLDVVTETETAAEPKQDSASPVVPPADPADTTNVTPSTQSAPVAPEKPARHRGRHNGSPRVSFGSNSTLAAGESADTVVSIVGSSTSAGRVSDAIVSILGSSTSSGDVGDAVVSIMGNSRVTGGRVGYVVVSVMGSTYVNAPVHGDVVAALGGVELGPDAVVYGDVVCVGGSVNRDPAAVVHGEVNNVSFGGIFNGFAGLHAWVEQCLMKVRPLAFGPHLMWAWWIAIGFLLLYVMMAALFPRGVERCIEKLEARPGATLLTALLVFVITPFAALLLLLTVVGAPALVLFLFVAGLFGKMVMIAWIGRLITRPFGSSAPIHPAFAVLLGGIIVLGLYTIPVVGFLTMKLLGWLGTGLVVYTLFSGISQRRAERAVVSGPRVSPASPFTAPTTATESAGFTGATAGAGPTTAVPPPVTAAPIIVAASTLQRAGFWIRIAASLLDALLVGIAISLLPGFLRPNFLLVYAVYCIILWALKGTTVGGIVCNLKVVRLDDRPLDWTTALVRSLSGFLSLFAAGIGFIWVAFDDQRQSWHDKIAGTTVVHVPKGVSLV